MLNKDKEVLNQILESYGKDAVLNALNESEDRQGVIDSEFHVTFSVDCTSSLDLDSLEIELNSQVENLPFMIDDQYGLDNVLVTIGFNDKREAAEINSFVCNLLFDGNVEEYEREAELLFLGNPEQLGLNIQSNLNEGVFNSYKDMDKDRIKNAAKIESNLAAMKKLSAQIEESAKEKVKKYYYNSSSLEPEFVPWEAMRSEDRSHISNASPESLGYQSVAAYPRPDLNSAAVTVVISPTQAYSTSNNYYIFNNGLFDFIDDIEKQLSAEFEMEIIIKFKFFYGKKMREMLEDTSTIHLARNVSVKKFVKFLNKFLDINKKRKIPTSMSIPCIIIDKNIIDTPSSKPEAPWAKNFKLVGNDAQIFAGYGAYNILTSLD